MSTRLSLLALALLAPAASAGAFDPRHVPSDAPWVVHIDLEALGQSSLFRALQAQGHTMGDELDTERVKRDFGVNPFTDLTGLTTFAHGERAEAQVTVFTGKKALADGWAATATRKARGQKVAGRDVVQFGTGSTARFAALQPGLSKLGDDCAVVVATTEQALQTTLFVLQGEGYSIKNPPPAPDPLRSKDAFKMKLVPPSIGARPAAGSLIFVATAPASRYRENAHFMERALRMVSEFADLSDEDGRTFGLVSRSLEFDVSEIAGVLNIRFAVDGASPDEIGQLRDVLQRAATAQSTAGDEPAIASRVARLLAPLAFETVGTRLTLRYRYQSGEFVSDIDAVETARGVHTGG